MIRLKAVLSLLTRATVVCVMGAAVVTYLGHHALYGRRSVATLATLQSVEGLRTETLDALASERRVLENRVRRLRPDGLDLDLLEEQAREHLGYVRETDVVVITAR